MLFLRAFSVFNVVLNRRAHIQLRCHLLRNCVFYGVYFVMKWTLFTKRVSTILVKYTSKHLKKSPKKIINFLWKEMMKEAMWAVSVHNCAFVHFRVSYLVASEQCRCSFFHGWLILIPNKKASTPNVHTPTERLL